MFYLVYFLDWESNLNWSKSAAISASFLARDHLDFFSFILEWPEASSEKRASHLQGALLSRDGSPCATLFITVLFLPQLTENLQFQRVIKDRAVADDAETVSAWISSPTAPVQLVSSGIDGNSFKSSWMRG